MLEPYEWKRSRTVLRRESGSNPADLVDYKDMCRNLGGNWLNAGGGRNGRSNLLQIRPAPRDDEDETDKLYTDEGNGMSDMALHIKTLEIIFSLYLPSLSDMQKAVLKQTVIELYHQLQRCTKGT